MTTLINVLNSLKSRVVPALNNFLNIISNGTITKIKQYAAVSHHLNCNTYANTINNAAVRTVSQVPAKTFDTCTPHTIGIVLHPYFASPAISSMSFTTSLTRQMIKAKPAYKNVNLSSLEPFSVP